MTFSKFVEDEMVRLLQKDFRFSIKGRLRIVADLDKFKWKEDESVFNQKKEKTPHEFEALFDGEFLCFFNKNDKPDKVRLKILEGMLREYKSGKIIFNTAIRDEVRKQEAEKQKEQMTVKLDKATTPEEKMANDVIKTMAEKKGKRVSTK